MTTAKSGSRRSVGPVVATGRCRRPWPGPWLGVALVLTLVTGCGGDVSEPTRPADASTWPALMEQFSASAQPVTEATTAVAGSIGWTFPSNGLVLPGGSGRGYLHTTEPVGDCYVRVVFYFLDPATPESNTGLLLDIAEAGPVWPKCLEVQGKWVDLGEVRSNGGYGEIRHTRAAPPGASKRPLDEDQTIEVVVCDGIADIFINGEESATATLNGDGPGLVGVQEERNGVAFRTFAIAPLSDGDRDAVRRLRKADKSGD